MRSSRARPGPTFHSPLQARSWGLYGLLCLCALAGFAAPGARAQDGLRTEGDVASAQGLYAAEVPVNSQAWVIAAGVLTACSSAATATS